MYCVCRRTITSFTQPATFFNVRFKTMQAWQIFEFGGKEKLHINPEAQIPTISNCLDVLVKVHGASVNPLDVQMLNGYGKTTFNFMRQLSNCSINTPEFPLILGRDFSGTIVHVGKKVKSFKIGDEVWGALSPWQNGSHAEYVLTSACHISKKPSVLNHVEASSFPYAALTAWSALTMFGGLSEKSAFGKKILIIGASGGVGTFSVQVLKSWGANVVVTCSSDATDMLLNLGADHALDYHSSTFSQNLSDLKPFDLIFDNVGKDHPEKCVDLLRKWSNSKYITLVSPLLKNTDDKGLIFGTTLSSLQASLDTIMSFKDGRSFRWAYFMPNGCALSKISRMIDNNQIRPVIQKIYSFNEIHDAFENVLSGHARGKTVINVVQNVEIPYQSNEKESVDQ